MVNKVITPTDLANSTVDPNTGFSTGLIDRIAVEGTQAAPGVPIAKDELETFTKRGLGFNSMNPEYSQELRAQNQYKRDQWANAFLKMGTLGFTTFADGTVGTLVGLGNVAVGGENGKTEFSDFWDNPFSNAMADIGQKVEKELPNYRTKQELNNPWYVNMLPGSGGATNFWADTIMKNFGFAIGAMAAGVVTGGVYGELSGSKEVAKNIAKNIAKKMVISEDAAIEMLQQGKVPATELLGELKRDADILNKINLVQEIAGSTAGAIGEARIETINGSRNYYQQLVDSGVNPDQASQMSKEAGNVQFVLNAALLSLDKFAQYRNLFGGGYKSQAEFFGKMLGNFEKGFTAEPISMIGKVGKVLKNPLIEGSEEMNQYWIERASQDFTDRRYDTEANSIVNDFLGSAVSTFSDVYGTEQGWEQGFAGFITGAVGLPSIPGMVQRVKGNKNAQIWGGGVYGDLQEVKEADNKAKQAVEALNMITKDPSFSNLYYGAVVDASLELDKQRALQQGRVFDYKNAEHDQFLNHVLTSINVGKFDDFVSFLENKKGLSGNEIRQALTTNKYQTKDEEGNEKIIIDETNPVDLYKDKTDDEISEMHNERTDKLISKAKKIRDIREQIRIKSASKLNPQIEDALTRVASSIGDVEERASNLITDLNKYLNNIVDITDSRNLDTDESPVINLDPINVVETLDKIQDEKIFNSLNERLHKHKLQSLLFGQIDPKTTEELVQDLNDLKSLSDRRRFFVDTYVSAFKDPAKFQESLQEKEAVKASEVEDNYAESTVTVGAKFKDAEGNEWVVRPNTAEGKFSLAQLKEDGTYESHPQMSNKSKAEIARFIDSNKLTSTGIDEEVAKETDLKQIKENRVKDLVKKIQSFKNGAALKKFWEKEIQPLGLANNDQIKRYISQQYFKITGKVMQDITLEKPEDRDVAELKDLEVMIEQATSLAEIADIMNNIVYPLYPSGSVIGKEFREKAIKKLDELREIKQRQLEALEKAVEDRYKNLDKILDDVNLLKTKVSNLEQDLADSVAFVKEVSERSNKGRNAKKNKELLEKAIEARKKVEDVLAEAKQELNNKEKLEEAISSEIDFLEKTIDRIKDDTKTLRLADKLTEDKKELAEKEINNHRFTVDRLNTHLKYTREDIKGLKELIQKLEDYIHVLENTVIPTYQLLTDFTSDNLDKFVNQVKDIVGKEQDPAKRAFYQKVLKNPEEYFYSVEGKPFIIRELINARKELIQQRENLDKALSKEKGLLKALQDKERIAELRKDIPIFEKILKGDPSDKKAYPGLYKEIQIAKKEAPKALDPKDLGLKATSEFKTADEDNASTSSLDKETYDKGEEVFDNAKRSIQDLVSALTNNQEKTDEAGMRYYHFLDNVPVNGHKLRVVIPTQAQLSESARNRQAEDVAKYGEAFGTILWGVVVNHENKPVDQNNNVISEDEIYTKGVYSPFPINLKGQFGDRYYGSEEQAKKAQDELMSFRRNLYDRIKGGETPMLVNLSKSNGIPVEIDNAKEAFKSGIGLTAMLDLGESKNLEDYTIQIATLSPSDGKAYIIHNGKKVVKPGYIYVIDEKTGNIYNVKTDRLSTDHVDSIINLFKGFANGLVVEDGKIDMKSAVNSAASLLPQGSRVGEEGEYNSIFKVLEKLVFWTGNNLNDKNQPINKNPKTAFYFNPNSTVPGGEVIVGSDANGKVLSYPLVTVVDGVVRFNTQLEERLKQFLPTLHINARSRLLNQTGAYFEVKNVKLNDTGIIESVSFTKHDSYAKFLSKHLFSPIIPRSFLSATGKSTQFVNKYLRFDNSWLSVKNEEKAPKKQEEVPVVKSTGIKTLAERFGIKTESETTKEVKAEVKTENKPETKKLLSSKLTESTGSTGSLMDLSIPESKGLTAEEVFSKYGANAPAEIIDGLPAKEAEMYIDMIMGDETSDDWLGEKEDLKDIEAKKADIERRRQEELIDFTTSKISFQELKDNLNNNVNGKYPYRTIIYNDFDVYEYKDGKFFPLQVASSGNQNLESIVYQEAQGKEVNFFEGKNIRLDKTGIFHSERLTGRSPIKRLLNYKKRTGQGRIDEQFGQVIVNINAKYDAELASIDKKLNKLADKKVYEKANTEEEIAWFKSKFPNVPIEVVTKLIDNKAWGQFKNAAVYIYNEAEIGTTYHEAFHVVSQLFLKPTERKSLYKEWRKQNTGEYTDKEVEEALAEEFRDFKLGKEIKNSPVKKSFFQRLLDFIKEFIFKVTGGRYGKAASIADVFARIEKGYYSTKTFNKDNNTKFYREYKGIIAGDPSHTESFTKDVLATTTLYFALNVYNSENLNKLFRGEKIEAQDLNAAYEFVKNKFAAERVKNLKRAMSLPEGSKVKERLKSLADDLNFVLLNFDNNKENSVRALHSKYMEQFNVKFIETDDFNENDEKGKDATQLWAEESLKISTKVNASKIIKFLISTLPMKETISASTIADDLREAGDDFEKIAKAWENAFMKAPDRKNSLGMPQAVDFGKTFSALIDKLSNTRSAKEQEVLMRQLIQEIPGLTVLMSRLNMTQFLKDSSNFKFEDALQLMQFTQTFAKNRNEFLINLIDENGRSKFINDNERIKLIKILNSWASNASRTVLKLSDSGQRLIKKKDFEIPGTVAEALKTLETLGVKFSRLDYTKDMYSNSVLFSSILESLGIKPNAFVTRVGNMVNGINKDKEDINFYNPELEGTSGFHGDRQYLVDIEARSGFEFSENSTWNIDGERVYLNTLNSYLSNVKNMINNAKTEDEVVAELPHLVSPYSKHSLWMDRLFQDGTKKKDAKLNFEIIFGVREFGSGIGDSFYDLKRPDRLAMWINAGLQGKYSFLRASDNKLERFIGVGELISQDEITNGSYLNHYVNYLKDEVDFFFNEDLSKWDKGNNYQSLDVEGNLSFKDLKGIIIDIIKDKNPQLYAKLNQKSFDLVNNAIQRNEADIKAVLDEFFKTRTREFIDMLNEANVISAMPQGNFVNFGLDLPKEGTAMVEETGGKKMKEVGTVSNATLTSALTRFFINDFTNNIEQTKILTGHPVFYGNVDNFFKRMSGLAGTKKIVNVDESTNLFIDKNLVRQDGKTTQNNNFQGQPIVKTTVLADVMAYSDYVEDYKEHFVKYFEDKGLSNQAAKRKANDLLGPYKAMTEADAQGYITIDEFREFLFRTGDWSIELESWYQWEIQEGWKGKKVTWPNKPSYGKLAGQEIKRVDFKDVVANPQKPQHFGPLAEDGFIPGFYKLSVLPLIPSVTYGKKIDNLRRAALDKTSNLYQTGVFVFESGNKVGTKLYNNGIPNTANLTQKLGEPSKNPLYDNQGNLNLKDPNIKTQNTFYKYWGIQLDVAPKVKKENVFGTQMGKQILNASYENGEPKAMRFIVDGKLQAANKQATRDKVNEYINLMDRRIQIGVQELKEKLGVVKEGDTWKVGNIDNLKAKLIDAAKEKEMPENVYDTIAQLDPEFGIDALLNAEKIEQILSAMADKLTTSRKFHGSAKIQGAYTMFENDDNFGREFTVVNKNTEEAYTGIKDLTEFFKNRDRKNYTVNVSSSKLKTYTNKDGKVTRMQVYLPHFFKELSTIDGEKISPLIDKQLLEKIIGFRIPTQGMNSIEAIEIVGFLPQSAGELIILPTEIVAKAGSDFDIDKLNVLLPNYKVNLINKGQGFSYDNLESIEYIRYEEGTNDIKAIDNRIIELLQDFALSPDNFFQLTNPNSADKLKDASQRVQWIINTKPTNLNDEKAFEEWKSKQEKEKKNLPLYNLVDRLFITSVTERNMIGKALVGIGALQATNNVMAQLYNLYIAHKIQVKDSTVDTKINLKGANINDNNEIVLSNLLNGDDDEIWELLSQFINAAVDAAKDPFIIDLNVLTSTADVFTLLLRSGVPVGTAAAFMSQPIIRKYIHNQSIYESHIAEVNDVKKYRDDIIATTLASFGSNKLEGNEVFDQTQLELMLRDTDKTAGYNKKQAQILGDFLRYQQVAKKLSESINATTYDTGAYKNTGELIYRLTKTQLVADNGEIGNFWKMFSEGGYFKGMHSANMEARDMFTPLFQFLKNDAVRTVFDDYLKIYLNNSISEDERDEAIRKFKSDFITYMLQTQSFTIDGTSQGKVTKDFERLFKGENSLPVKIARYKESKDYVPNLLLDELFTIFADDISNLRMFSSKLDKLEADSVTNDWLNLYETQPELAMDLTKFIILQSGVANSPINFINFMPANVYGEIVKEVFKNKPNTGDALQFMAEFFQQAANATKDSIVPDVTRKSSKSAPKEYPLVKMKVKNPKWSKKNQDKSIPFYLPEPKLMINPNYEGPLLNYFDVNENGNVSVLGKWNMRNSSSVYLYGTGNKSDVIQPYFPSTMDLFTELDKVAVKTGVPELFESNPELANVGTPAQYSAYLDTVFPDSKVKDIVYHKTESITEDKKLSFDKFKKGRTSFYFAETPEIKFGARTKGISFPFLLDIKNPRLSNEYNIDITEPYEKEDGVLITPFFKETGANWYVVFEPEQIHILSSKKDLEMFKNFINFTKSEYAKQGFKKFVDKLTFDKNLAQKIQDKLQKLYPEIKLNITNNPVWEQGDNILNQLIQDDYFEGNPKYFTEIERISNLILNKLKYKIKEFNGKYDESITDLEKYKSKVLNDLLKEIGITGFITNLNQLKERLNSKELQTSLKENLEQIKENKENFKKQLDNFYSIKRLLNNYLKHFNLSKYNNSQQAIIKQYLPNLFKENKFKSDKQAIAFNKKRINSEEWANKVFDLNKITIGFLSNNSKENKIETLLNYFKIEPTDAAERIYVTIENELNRREKFFNSEKIQSKINAKIVEDKIKADNEKAERERIRLKELNKFKNSTVVFEVESLVGGRNLHSLERVLESENINEELAIIKNNGYSLDKTPNGTKSNLYKSILALPEVNGNIEIANKLKSLVYSDNFLNWFGDWINNSEGSSKIVDENGEPKLVYHGSGRNFNKFSEEKRGSATGKWKDRLSDSEMSFMFTDNPTVAFYYAIIERQQILGEVLYYVRKAGQEPTQQLITEMYEKYPSIKQWVNSLKEKGLEKTEILEEFKRIYREYSEIRELSEGGAIGNSNSYLNNMRIAISYLQENKSKILKNGFSKDIGKSTTAKVPNLGKHHTVFLYSSKEYRTSYILADGRLTGFEDKSLNDKNIKDLTSEEYDKVVSQFQEDYIYLYNKIEDELKAGGFQPKIYPVFLNAKSVNSKDFKGRPFMFQQGDTEEVVKRRESIGAAFEVADLVEEALNSGLEGSIIGNIADPNVGTNYSVFKANQIKSVFNEGEYSFKNDSFYNQLVNGRIIGQANIKAMTVLVDAINQKQDTLPHEYAHHYIAWFRDTPIVQEAIKKWGSEEALVQSIGEQVVKQKGEAYNWWNNFVKWIMNQFNSLSKLQKEELTQILTDAFLTRQDLGSKQDMNMFKEFVKKENSTGIVEEPLFAELDKLGLEKISNHAMSYKMPAKENLTGKDTSTLDLVEKGLRTATTRSYPLGKIGDIITFEGRPQKYKIIRVEQLTKEKVENIDWIKEWSKKEQWTIEHFKSVLGGKTVHIGSFQTSFEKIEENTDPLTKCE